MNGEMESVVIITATFQANLPANSLINAKIQFDPALDPQTEVRVPISEAWVIDDVFVSSSQSVDAILQFEKNYGETVARTPPINSMIVSNPSRPMIKPAVYGPGEILTIKAQNLAAIGSSAVTITVYAKIKRFK